VTLTGEWAPHEALFVKLLRPLVGTQIVLFVVVSDVEMQMKNPRATVYAAFDYTAENDDELTFSVGDQLIVMQCSDDIETEWWWCQLGEARGYVPQNLLSVS